MGCFMFHRWPKWSAPRPAHDRHSRDIVVQSRTCLDCGKVAVRTVYASGNGPLSVLNPADAEGGE